MSTSMIGRTLGRYEITGEIGRGGMGVVYRALQTSLNRTVALKMLPLAFAQTPELLGRFRREAETLARLSHENVVHVYDVEELDGNPFIVMELVPGPSLGQLLREGQALPPAVVRDIGLAIAAGLGAAHQEGIVHRDIKPDNILFTPSGRPKLTDFGIARVEDAQPQTLTGSLLGTPQYIAPEQANGERATERSDVYSLGVTLYEMAAGKRPFLGNNPIEIYLKHIQEPVPSLQDTAPDIPGPLATLITRCLQKEPSARPADGLALAHELETLELGELPGRALRDWFSSRGATATSQAESEPTRLRSDEITVGHGQSVVAESKDADPVPQEAGFADAGPGPVEAGATVSDPGPVEAIGPTVARPEPIRRGSGSPEHPRRSPRRTWYAGSAGLALVLVAGVLWLSRTAAERANEDDSIPNPASVAGAARSGEPGGPGADSGIDDPLRSSGGQLGDPPSEGTTEGASDQASSAVANQSPVSGGVSPDPIQERQIRSQIFGLLASFAADLSSLGPVAATERHALAGVGTRLGAEIAGLLGPYESLRASASGVDIAMLAGPEASVRFRQELAVIAKNGDEQIRVLRHDWKVVPQGHGWKIAEGTVVTE